MIIMSSSMPTIPVDIANTTLSNNLSTTLSKIALTSSLWIRILTLTCMISIDVCVLLGNLLVICAFLRTKRLQTVTNYFIASLALADALVAIFVLPLSIYYYQRDRSWKLGLVLCDLWVSSDVLLCTSSILNLTCISVDRYMAITKPLTYTAYRSKFLARIMILLVWIFSAVITCPPIFGWRDSNRRHTVEHEHKCELNTARGYVVYSALGSFYIPAVVMIFVYIRIFMVVYDRENSMHKFQDNKINTSVYLPIQANQNGLPNVKNFIKDTHENNQSSTKQSKIMHCCCLCFRKTSQQNNLSVTHQELCSTSNESSSARERKQNGHLKSRSTNNTNQNRSNLRPTTLPLISKTKSKKTLLCESCTISTRTLSGLFDNSYHNRRTHLLRIGAEYQFRTCDSPCYEMKTFQDSLPSLIKNRSQSFEESTKADTRNSDVDLIRCGQLKSSMLLGSTNLIDRQRNDNDDDCLSNPASKKTLKQHMRKIAQSLNELTNVLAPSSSSNEPMKEYEKCHPNNVLDCSSSVKQKLTSSTVDLSSTRQKPSNEHSRINRRMKPSHLSQLPPSAILIENFKQQYNIAQNHTSKPPTSPTLSSVQSSQSLRSLRRLNENPVNNSKKSYCYCCSCLQPLNHWYGGKRQHIHYRTPNQSLTYDDDDDDEKLSSIETNTRPTVTSLGLRTPDTSNHNTLLSLSSYCHQHQHHHHPQQCFVGGNSQTSSHDVNRRERIRFMKEQRTAKTLAVVVGGFILFWLPFFIMYVIPPDVYSFSAQTITLITWLGYFNSIINPFIYAYCSKQFRMAFWNITFGMCASKPANLSAVSTRTKQSTRSQMNT